VASDAELLLPQAGNEMEAASASSAQTCLPPAMPV